MRAAPALATVLCLVLALCGTAHSQQCSHTDLNGEKPQTVTLKPGEIKAFRYVIPAAETGQECASAYHGVFCPVASTRWVRVDAHAQRHTVELRVTAYEELCPSSNASVGQRMVGQHVGLVERIGHLSRPLCINATTRWWPDSRQAVVYATIRVVKGEYTPLPTEPVAVTIGAWPGNTTAPVPGGCCATCVVDNDPNLRINFVEDQTTIDAMDANMGIPTRDAGIECACDFVAEYGRDPRSSSGIGTLEYHVYKSYISSCGSPLKRKFSASQLYNALARMSTPEGVRSNGHKVETSLYPIQTKQWTADIVPGEGVVYNVLVTDTRNQYLHPSWPQHVFESVYTPSVSYGCSFYNEPGVVSCDNLENTSILVIAAFVALAGLLMALLGHKYFLVELFVMATMVWGFVFIVIVARLEPDLSEPVKFGAALGCGVGGALITLAVWYFFNALGSMLILIGCVLGGVVSAFIFATPLGDIRLFENDLNYGMSFACCVLIFPVIFILHGKLLNIMSSSFVGMYMLLAGLDMYIGSSMAEVTLSVYKRATLKDYGRDYSGSFFSDDFNGCANFALNVGMLSLWIVLSLIAMVVQYRISGKLEFPISNFHRRRRSRRNPEGRPLLDVSPRPARRVIQPHEMRRSTGAGKGRSAGPTPSSRQIQQERLPDFPPEVLARASSERTIYE